MDYKNMIIIIFILVILYYLSFKKKEHFSKNINSESIIAIKNFARLNNFKTIGFNGNLDFENDISSKNLVVDGTITVKGGGEFTATAGSNNRYYFQDSENAGRLRIGGVWNTPGIYAEDNKKLNIKSNVKIIANDCNLYGFRDEKKIDVKKIDNIPIDNFVKNNEKFYFLKRSKIGWHLGNWWTNDKKLLIHDAKNFELSREK